MKAPILVMLINIAFFLAGCESTAVQGAGEDRGVTTQSARTAPTVSLAEPGEHAASRGERRLNISVTPADNETYDAALNLAHAAGGTETSLSIYWDEIETAPGVYNPDPDWLAIANQYYPVKQTAVALAISVIDTNNLRLPADLAYKALDDPQVISRFNELLTYIAAQIPNLQLSSVAIGNEVDIYLGDNHAQWTAFANFFTAASAYARALWPTVPVGSKVTFSGIAGEQKETIQTFQGQCDVVLVTYYPLQSDFTARPPATAHADFQLLSAAFPEKTIHLLEAGYPSGALNGSSPEKQAAFIHELFLAWDAHQEQIPVLNLTWLTEMPEASIQNMTTYYGLDAPGFISYLATLGLREGDGTAKPAWEQLRAETAARGW